MKKLSTAKPAAHAKFLLRLWEHGLVMVESAKLGAPGAKDEKVLTIFLR